MKKFVQKKKFQSAILLFYLYLVFVLVKIANSFLWFELSLKNVFPCKNDYERNWGSIKTGRNLSLKVDSSYTLFIQTPLLSLIQLWKLHVHYSYHPNQNHAYARRTVQCANLKGDGIPSSNRLLSIVGLLLVGRAISILHRLNSTLIGVIQLESCTVLCYVVTDRL